LKSALYSAPPTYMLEVGKQASNFFEPCYDGYGNKTYRLKSIEQYSKEHNTREQPSKRYFQATNLPDIVNTYPFARKDAKPADIERGQSFL
jgi:dual specificity protein kinase YAK1